MTVQDNVAFGLRRKGVPRRETSRRVDEMPGIVDLTGRGQRRPRKLSGGQQQRVARALVSNPQALLLDEPSQRVMTLSGCRGRPQAFVPHRVEEFP